ncbi:hypothetical protein KQH82_13110 [bacterium]|nr:hypothetical protein [bacterium]
MQYKLRRTELYLVEVLRQFAFLEKLGYKGTFLRLYGRETGLVYETLRREIDINWEGRFRVVFVNGDLWPPRRFDQSFDVESVMHSFDVTCQVGLEDSDIPLTVERYAAFLKTHLMSVIKGKSWISQSAM